MYHKKITGLNFRYVPENIHHLKITKTRVSISIRSNLLSLLSWFYRHVIFAPSSINSYSGASFPGVIDAIFNATTVQDWEFVHQQLDVVAIHIRYATQIMNQPGVEWVKN